MKRQYIKTKQNPEKRGPKAGSKIDAPHACRVCAEPLPLAEAYHRKNGSIAWLCKPCAAKIAYRNTWKNKGAADIGQEVKRLLERVDILTDLMEAKQ